MESWQFIQSPAGEWYWLCSNVISRQTRESPATFKTRMECVANAMSSGYQKMTVAATNGQKQASPRKNAPEKRHASGTEGTGQHDRSGTFAAPAAPKRASRRSRSKSSRQPKPGKSLASG
jgi:hypothetical protein